MHHTCTWSDKPATHLVVKNVPRSACCDRSPVSCLRRCFDSNPFWWMGCWKLVTRQKFWWNETVFVFQKTQFFSKDFNEPCLDTCCADNSWRAMSTKALLFTFLDFREEKNGDFSRNYFADNRAKFLMLCLCFARREHPRLLQKVLEKNFKKMVNGQTVVKWTTPAETPFAVCPPVSVSQAIDHFWGVALFSNHRSSRPSLFVQVNFFYVNQNV
jgi:hypothetical protein